jgi:hypothetical protein
MYQLPNESKFPAKLVSFGSGLQLLQAGTHLEIQRWTFRVRDQQAASLQHSDDAATFRLPERPVRTGYWWF